MCGINIIAFYSSTVFKEAGCSEFKALLASWGFGLSNFIFAWLAVWTIDTFGRRPLLLFTFPNTAWCSLAAGLCTLIPKTSRAHVGLVALFTYLFAIFYSPGEDPVPFTYSAEIFPFLHHEVGMSWAVATCLSWTTVLSITFPKIVATMGILNVFCLCAGLNIAIFIMIFLWMSEAKRRSLGELDYVSAISKSKFIKYNFIGVAPRWFKRYVLLRHNTAPEPLYDFDRRNGGIAGITTQDDLAVDSSAVVTVDSREYITAPETQNTPAVTDADAVFMIARFEREAAAFRRCSWHGSGANKHSGSDDMYTM